MARLLWMVCLVWAEFAAANIPAHRPVSGALPAPASSVTANGQSAERYGDFSFARTDLPMTGNDTFTIIAQNQFGSATNTATYNLPTSISITHDANGNLTSDGTRSFFYNAENRLTNITVAAKWKVEFVYDGLGRRRILREYGWQGGQWVKTNETRYVCDGLLPIQERDSNNVVRLSYTRGPDLSGSVQGAGGIGGLLARTDPAGSLFYHADGAGNITALMDMAGNVTGRYQYGPFGRLSGMWGPMAALNVMRFSSMPQHANSGLSLYPFRDYDANLQRWLTHDPLGERGSINLYRFVRNSPVNRIDPDGLEDFILMDFQTDFSSPGWTQGYREGLGIAGPAAAEMGASMVPGVGEAMDLMVLGDPDSKWWEKGLAGVSLGVNALTEGMLPNLGGLLKGGKRLCKEKKMNVGESGHHVPAVRKSKGRPFEVGRGDKTRPTIHSRGADSGRDHWRMHDAERKYIGPRRGDFPGTDAELFAAYRKAYEGLDEIRVDVRSPDGTHVLGSDVSPREAVDLIENWLRQQGAK